MIQSPQKATHDDLMALNLCHPQAEALAEEVAFASADDLDAQAPQPGA